MAEPRMCEVCKQREATVHLTQIVKDSKMRVHLCEECSQRQGPISPELLASMVPKIAKVVAEAEVSGGEGSEPELTCSYCGLSFDDFRRSGRLGCPDDYDVFSGRLEPLLKRLHEAVRHRGKVPVTSDSSALAQVEVRNLEAELREAVSKEDYEGAARLRDQIRAVKKELHGAE